MYNENSNNKNAWVTELIIKVFIVIAFMLSSNILMYHFLPWVFWRDVVTIVSFFLGVYWIFGHETTQYRYGLISDELTIYVGKGKRERLILNISVADIEKIVKRLPDIDCGSCGAPSCHAFAEDIVLGEATENDCIFRMREQIQSLLQRKEEQNHDSE